MTRLRHLAVGALLLAATALPHAAPPGYGIDEHLVQVGGRTYAEAVAHAPSPMHIEFNLTKNDPRLESYHECGHATVCHYRYRVTCPNELHVWFGVSHWYAPFGSRLYDDVFSVCGSTW